MRIEDPNPYTSRFSAETWKGFVESRKPTQVVCNLHEPLQDHPCLNVDVRSCRLNALTEANVHPVPIFSPLDEFTNPREGELADYNWVDLGGVRSPLKIYIYDGPRWYDCATCEFMLSMGIARWSHIKLAFNATAHRPAKELALKLRRIRAIWE